ncbi:hypothetical protein NPIL_271231 [Nephila pilipes]|uniref:Uncharacterized protein n=1 Tax=Nephila pilipes TaxID=299642 RepID=A0A8X6T9Q6_NEPPI|nr:hypothetical protein NPIL_271231 [Nephila pilipes]
MLLRCSYWSAHQQRLRRHPSPPVIVYFFALDHSLTIRNRTNGVSGPVRKIFCPCANEELWQCYLRFGTITLAAKYALAALSPFWYNNISSKERFGNQRTIVTVSEPVLPVLFICYYCLLSCPLCKFCPPELRSD